MPDMPHDAISYLNFWRFQPPGQPPFGSMYPMGGNNSQNPMLVMQQPFMDMGALITAAMPAVPVPPVGNCKNGKGMPKL